MTVKRYFDSCRERLWKLLSQVDFSYGCKSYEGTIEIIHTYPNYFESPETLPDYEGVNIVLYCYVLGDHRHYDFRGKTFYQAVKRFDEWLTEQEQIEREANNNENT